MSLHSDLLEQANHLARREPRRPRQASLRRAISNAYYALFHLLTNEASRMLVRNKALRGLVVRAFGHDEMKQACGAFAARGLPPYIVVLNLGAVPPELQRVAEAFVDLQEARHNADYKVDKAFSRKQVQHLVGRVDQAFQNWRTIRKQPIAHLFLASLLMWKKWR